MGGCGESAGDEETRVRGKCGGGKGGKQGAGKFRVAGKTPPVEVFDLGTTGVCVTKKS